MSNWHYAKSGEKHGPITAAQLKELAKSGQLAPDDLVWREDMKEWRKAASVKGLFSSNQQPNSVSSPPQSVAAARQEELPFWKRPAVIALAFLLFWPAGAYLLWKKFNTSSTDSTSKFPSVPRSWVFAGAGIGAILLVGAIVLTITQTSAARKEIAEATTLWEEGRHDEAAVLYQTIINKRGPFIPDDQESLVYGRVIDFLSQHNRHQEARLILEKLNRLSPSATPLVESEVSQDLMADIRREQEAERQRLAAEKQRQEAQQQLEAERAALARAAKNPLTLDKSGRADFLDNTATYKGKTVRFECKWTGDGWRNRSTGRMTKLELLVFHSGGSFRFQVDVPDDLTMPNLQGSDYLFVTFLCEQGSLARGNVALKIERS